MHATSLVKTGFIFTALFTLGLFSAGVARADDSPAAAAATDIVAAPTPGATQATATAAAPNPWDGKLHVDITPYVWLPTINGQFRFHLSDFRGGNGPIATDLSQTLDTQIGPNSYLANINFALMGTATARIGRLALYTDVINTNFSTSNASTLNLTGPRGNLNVAIASKAQAQVVSTIFTVAPSYTIFHDGKTFADLMVGGQFEGLSVNANAQLTGPLGNTYSAGASRKENYSAVIAGSYGEIGLGGHWSAPYYLDFGFGAPTSWEYLLGIKYGNLAVSWRYLQFNAGSSTALLQRLTLGGPMIGYTFHF